MNETDLLGDEIKMRCADTNPAIAQQVREQALPGFIALLLMLLIFALSISTVQAQGGAAVEIGSGTLDSDRSAGPKWTRIDFAPQNSGNHTISVDWDSNADIRFTLFRIISNSNKQKIQTINDGTSPAIWTGTLDSSEAYYLGIWSVSGSANFTATLEEDTGQGTSLAIVSQPTDQNVVDGDNATFNVVANGIGTLSYRWFVTPAPIDDGAGGMTIFPQTEIPGSNSATLSINPATLADDGNVYSVEITDDNSVINSNDATLFVAEIPASLIITDQPDDQTVDEGDNATFSVNASGNGTLFYQWFVNNSAISGATNPSYTVVSASIGDDGNVYRVDISDDNGSLSSNNATLTVNDDDNPVTIVNIGQGTVDRDRNAGPRWVRVDFDPLASAVHTISVSWDSDADVQFNVRESNGTKISPTLRGSNPGVWSGALDANKQYYLGLWSAEGIANFTATIQAGVQLSIVSQPSDVTVTAGSNATFTVDALGSGTLNYQWFADNTLLTGENSDSLTVFSTMLSESGTQFRVDVSNATDTVMSDVATLTVNPPPANNGLIARWKMNESASASIMRDDSGNGHKGTIGADVVTGVSDNGETS